MRIGALPEGANHLKGGDTACVNLLRVSAREKTFDVWQEGWPGIWKVSCDDIFEDVGELNSDAPVWGCSQERKKMGFQGGTITRCNGDLVWSKRCGDVEVGGIYSVLDKDDASLSGGSEDNFFSWSYMRVLMSQG